MAGDPLDLVKPKVHDRITRGALPFNEYTFFPILLSNVYQDYPQLLLFNMGLLEYPSCETLGPNHFVGSMFRESAEDINERYRNIEDALSEEVPDLHSAAYEFGFLRHTAQDFPTLTGLKSEPRTATILTNLMDVSHRIIARATMKMH